MITMCTFVCAGCMATRSSLDAVSYLHGQFLPSIESLDLTAMHLLHYFPDATVFEPKGKDRSTLGEGACVVMGPKMGIIGACAFACACAHTCACVCA